MRLLRTLLQRTRSLLRGTSADDELTREIELHLDQLTREYVAEGLSDEEARHAARRAFGPATLVEERCRDTRRVSVVRDVVRDGRHAARLLMRAPAFTLAATLSIAFGVGANTAIFSLIDTVLLRTLPVDRPNDLVFFRTIGTNDTSGAPPYPWFERVREDTRTFAGMAVFATDEMRGEIDGQPEQIYGQVVSGSYFDVLGVRPALGRLLAPADETMAAPVAVLDHRYWLRRFGGRRDALGRTIRVGARSYTIVGVTPPEFGGLGPGRRVEVTTPLLGDAPLRRNGMSWWCDVVARLRPGVSAEQAAASGDAAFQAHMETVTVDPEMRRTHLHHVDVVSAAHGLDRLRGRFAMPLQALMALSMAVLLIGCANLATLLLVRGEGRTRELAIRQATGASIGRLLRQMLTETLLLFVLGAAGSLVVARLALDVLVGFFATGRNAITLDATIHWRSAAFAAAITLGAAVLTGLWPALRTLRVSPQAAMRGGDTRIGGGARARASARLLIAGQVALCLALVVSALLFATTMRNLRTVDLGFTAERVLTQSLDLIGTPNAATVDRTRVWTRVVDRLRALPGVRSVSLSVLTPMSGRDTGKLLGGPGVASRGLVDRVVHVNHISEDYLEVFAIRVLQGRALTVADRAAHVAVVNETTQQALFAGRSAVGESLEFSEGRRYEIVGVVKDAKHRTLREPRQRMVYLPLWQPVDPIGRITLSIATHGDPKALALTVAREVRAIEPGTLVSDVFDVQEQVDATIISERLLATLGGAFALLALGLAAVGIYGVLSYSVAERRGEIALRMALGARPSRVIREIWSDVQWPIVAGVAAGLVAAWLTARVIGALLFGVAPLDAGTYLLGVVLLMVVACSAAALPLLRAASLSPAEVIRR
jgi:predicted permease